MEALISFVILIAILALVYWLLDKVLVPLLPQPFQGVAHVVIVMAFVIYLLVMLLRMLPGGFHLPLPKSR